MFERRLQPSVVDDLAQSPAVALLGPRQVGKTTLALAVAAGRPSLYLDLESERDRARLQEPEAWFAEHRHQLVVLDEVHRLPGLFPLLRGSIDAARREGRRAGLYLLLGSASLDLLAQSGETLAGRIAYREMHVLDVLEVGAHAQDGHWLRGGFPESLLASSDARSLRWRQDFIRSYLERDVPQFGPRIAAPTLRRFWTMLAHLQGSLLNVSQLARNLGVDGKTAGAYLDLMERLLLVRRLPPWQANVGKRLTKSPKVFVRDSGLVHALLDIATTDALLSHPVVGASWEGFVLENVLASAPAGVQPFFYRSSGGAEVDLLLAWPDGTLWAVEVKRSSTPQVERGFHSACADLQPARRLLVHPGADRFPLPHGVEAVPLHGLCAELAQTA